MLMSEMNIDIECYKNFSILPITEELTSWLIETIFKVSTDSFVDYNSNLVTISRNQNLKASNKPMFHFGEVPTYVSVCRFRK